MAEERNAEGLTRGEAAVRAEVVGAVEVRLAQLQQGGAGGGLDLSPGIIAEAAQAAADAAILSIKGGKTP